MEPENHNIIKALLEKYIRSECSREELRQLEDYLQQAADPKVLPDVEEVSNILGRKDSLPQESARRIQEEILASQPFTAPESPLVKKRTSHFFTRWAAAACLIGFISAGLWWANAPSSPSRPALASDSASIELTTWDGEVVSLSEQETLELIDNQGNLLGTQQDNLLKHLPQTASADLKYNSIRIPHGRRFSLQLSDGSMVHLNANSTFRYPISFIKGEQRAVYLTGEAYFDVAPDKDHPFIVHTQGLEVSVLGTKFNIQSYKDQTQENVVLVEGKVQVGNQQGRQVIMKPNQKLISQHDQMDLQQVNATALTSWKDGYLTVEGTALDQVIAQLETYYNISIHPADALNNNSIGGGKIYLSEQIENVMTTLSLLTKKQYSFTPNVRK